MKQAYNREALGHALKQVNKDKRFIHEFNIRDLDKAGIDKLVEERAQIKADRGDGTLESNIPGMRKWIENLIETSKADPKDLINRAYNNFFLELGPEEEALAAVIENW